MKVEHHLKKIEQITGSLAKLEPHQDSELVIEGCLLIAAHCINATMHRLGNLSPDMDIKHNKLFGFLKREKSPADESDNVASLFLTIENLRPSHVYGRGENGNSAETARVCLEKIKQVCDKL